MKMNKDKSKHLKTSFWLLTDKQIDIQKSSTKLKEDKLQWANIHLEKLPG